ncbi:hypothetical protein HanHA300_Chr09g0343541 [Helianthus annuus]|nr:hypothetical protein HanHA300_Chr09g0343541 [Helianthus annuus]KAJ0544725.1 hypothetical protein HanHA89_Chr09g0364781 [Helianthus annuus]
MWIRFYGGHWWRRAGFVTVHERRTTRDVRSEVCIASPVMAIKRLWFRSSSGNFPANISLKLN